MITGANTNVRYRGIVFHVQTEDSGRANPHIISHVYHGGTILASEKTVYSDHIETEDLEGLVRELIEAQHRQMLKLLSSGGLDSVIAERLGDTAVQQAAQLEAPTPAPELASTGAPTEPHESFEAGAPSEAAGQTLTGEPTADPVGSEARAVARAFGEGIGSQKPLDEMILDYLSQKARDRASARAGRPARKSNSNG
jgi:hypothetical protein